MCSPPSPGCALQTLVLAVLPTKYITQVILLDPHELAGQPLSGAARQKYFDNLKNLATFQFDAEHVHTFVILQSFLDLQQYKLSLGGPLTMDLSQILNGQPLQMMVKNTKVSAG